MRFTWDPKKAAGNQRKHGVSFRTAQEVFDDPHHVVLENYRLAGENEQRYQAIGLTRGLLLAAVIFVDRTENDTVTIRLISARKANRYETFLYHHGAAAV